MRHKEHKLANEVGFPLRCKFDGYEGKLSRPTPWFPRPYSAQHTGS